MAYGQYKCLYGGVARAYSASECCVLSTCTTTMTLCWRPLSVLFSSLWSLVVFDPFTVRHRCLPAVAALQSRICIVFMLSSHNGVVLSTRRRTNVAAVMCSIPGWRTCMRICRRICTSVVSRTFPMTLGFGVSGLGYTKRGGTPWQCQLSPACRGWTHSRAAASPCLTAGAR